MSTKIISKQPADLRLFIAVELPQPVIDEVLRIQSYFKKRKFFEGNYTHQGGMHITLKFLGDTTPEQLVLVQQTLGTLSTPLAQEQNGNTIKPRCLAARISDLDVFSAHQQIKILFLNVHCPELTPLVQKLDEILAPWYTAETRPFISHVTLARVKWVPDQEKLLEAIREFAVNKIDFTIDRFVLKHSELTPEGSIYTDLATYYLPNL
jgi:2'-5' RNA ligase